MKTTTVLSPPSWVGLGLLGQLAKLPRATDLRYTLTLHRVRVRYTQSMLGLLWAILHEA